MAVVIETTLGDITVDLYLNQRPVTCLNFLKLCKMKYYNFNLFHTIRNGFIAQTGDPTGEGNGGESIWGILEGREKRFFSGEKMPKIRHTDAGLLSMVCTDDMMVGSQFFFTLSSDLDSLDGVHCVIGEITEGHEVLRKLNDVICDETHRPYQDVRITHTVVLEDPFNDPPGLRAPSRSPSPSAERLKGGRIAPDEEIDETRGKSTAEIQEIIEEKEAKARATILEIVGDLPDAEIAPPENVLFVCKLNPVTTDDDLEIIFSRFGKIVSCEVIRDKKTGDSLQYAFIEFSDKKSCEDAYFKMDNVLIDDRRIHVDFSQSVSKIKWLGKGRGVKHVTDDNDNIEKRRSRSKDRYRDNKERHKHSKQRKQDDKEKYRSRRRNNDRDNERYHNRKSLIEKESTNHSKNRENNRSRSKDKGIERYTYASDQRQMEKTEKKIDKIHQSSKYGNYKNHWENAHRSRLDTRIYASKSQENNSSPKIQSQRHASDRQNKSNHSSKNYKTDHRECSKQSKHKYDSESESQMELKKRKTYHEDPKTPSPVLEKNKDKKDRNKKMMENIKGKKKNKNVKRKRRSSSSSESDTSDSTSSSSDSSSSSEGQTDKIKRKKKYSSSSSSSETSNTSSSSSSSSDSSSESTSSSSDSDINRKRRKKNKNIKKNKKK